MSAPDLGPAPLPSRLLVEITTLSRGRPLMALPTMGSVS